jgi:hypothetical protein
MVARMGALEAAHRYIHTRDRRCPPGHARREPSRMRQFVYFTASDAATELVAHSRTLLPPTEQSGRPVARRVDGFAEMTQWHR